MQLLFYSILALLFGSFANVLIYRLPANLSILSPGSYCPECKHSLSLLEKIPVISFVWQQGKCTKCKSKISWRYPVVELLLLLLAYPFMHYAQSTLEYFIILVLLTLTVALGFIDEQFHKLPLGLSYMGIVLVSAYTVFQGALFFDLQEDFGFFLHPMLARLANIAFQLGITMFVLDAFTHLCNRVFFKKIAEQICSSALTLRWSFLEKHMSVYYVFLLALAGALYGLRGLLALKLFFAVLGISYLFNEIILDYFIMPKFMDKNLMEPQPAPQAETRTILGGGDIAMLGLIAAVCGAQAAFFILLFAFYLVFLKLLLDKIMCLVSRKTFVLEATYPMGFALAIIFIADMMNMVYRGHHLFVELMRLLELN